MFCFVFSDPDGNLGLEFYVHILNLASRLPEMYRFHSKPGFSWICPFWSDAPGETPDLSQAVSLQGQHTPPDSKMTAHSFQ